MRENSISAEHGNGWKFPGLSWADQSQFVYCAYQGLSVEQPAPIVQRLLLAGSVHSAGQWMSDVSPVAGAGRSRPNAEILTGGFAKQRIRQMRTRPWRYVGLTRSRGSSMAASVACLASRSTAPSPPPKRNSRRQGPGALRGAVPAEEAGRAVADHQQDRHPPQRRQQLFPTDPCL